MDTIILAAGENERLRGIVPPYHKPLLVVNGRPIIVDLVENAMKLATVEDRVIVVCSPENVKAITGLIGQRNIHQHKMRYVIQTQPTGPVDAFQLGLELVTSSHFIMVCGDNIISEQCWEQFRDIPDKYHLAMATNTKARAEADRFTTVMVRPYSGESIFAKGCVGMPVGTVKVDCWIGPIRGNVEVFRRNMPVTREWSTKEGNGFDPVSFSVLFNHVTKGTQEVLFVNSDVIDIGIPEELS